MPYLPPSPALELPLVAGDAYRPVDLATGAAEPGPRVSNTVKGFEYKRWKQVLYSVGTFAQILVLPLWPFFLAKEAKDWSIARHYVKTMRYCLKAVWDHIAYGSLLRLIKYNVLHGPDYIKNRIAQRRGACTRCAKCCRAFNCIFLGQDARSGDYYCKVFGTSYWYYGTCGRYPIDQRDIDDHGCPGFSFPKTAEERREAVRKLPPKRLPLIAA
jgi:hypothetical protein